MSLRCIMGNVFSIFPLIKTEDKLLLPRLQVLHPYAESVYRDKVLQASPIPGTEKGKGKKVLVSSARSVLFLKSASHKSQKCNTKSLTQPIQWKLLTVRCVHHPE